MKYFKLVTNIGFGAYISRILWFLFKKWAKFVPANESPNGFDAYSLPIAGIIRYVDYDLYWDDDETPDPEAFEEWFVFQPDWLWWIYTDYLYPLKFKIRRIFVWLKILEPFKSTGGFLVPEEYVKELLKGIPYRTTVTINTKLYSGDIKRDDIA